MFAHEVIRINPRLKMNNKDGGRDRHFHQAVHVVCNERYEE